jgi:hypothetical protein
METPSQKRLPDEASRKLQSKLEGAISIAYLLFWALLLKSIGWLFGDTLDEKLGDKAGWLLVTLFIPLSMLLAAVIVIPSAYWVISRVYGNDTAEYITFRWRRSK